jgi:hypothetical protein
MTAERKSDGSNTVQRNMKRAPRQLAFHHSLPVRPVAAAGVRTQVPYGSQTKNATQLIKVAVEAALGLHSKMTFMALIIQRWMVLVFAITSTSATLFVRIRMHCTICALAVPR